MKYFSPPRSTRPVMREYPTIVQQKVQKEVDGKIIECFESVEIEPYKVNEGLKVSDFSLDVLIRNNAVDLLKENHPIAQSNLAVAATVENFE